MVDSPGHLGWGMLHKYVLRLVMSSCLHFCSIRFSINNAEVLARLLARSCIVKAGSPWVLSFLRCAANLPQL
jgi:hypothetical protein